jgi:eukaryotic-like serine/threonine-protein kinase
MNTLPSGLGVTAGPGTQSITTNESRKRTGEILAERYQLLERIGEGGMGEVYVARHLVLGRRFAVKLIHPKLVRSANLLRRFSCEALAAGRLESDHVVAVTDCGHTGDGSPFYVMELLKGADLRQLLRRAGPLPLQKVLGIVLDVCRGLSAAHANGLVHRDLKPENIFVVTRDDGSQSAKILDFGVVQLRDESSSSRPGTLIGTVKYMSPEQVLAEGSVDARADIYALGVIVYECLSGQVPFVGGSTEEVLFRILNGAIKPLRDSTGELPDGFEESVMRALARSPGDRYSTIADFAQSLLRFRGSLASPVRLHQLCTKPIRAKEVLRAALRLLQRSARLHVSFSGESKHSRLPARSIGGINATTSVSKSGRTGLPGER